MARLSARSHITINATFTVDEEEMRALDALAGYGDDSFIKHFYEKLGKAYMRDHEKGLRRFLQTIRKEMSGPIYQVDHARSLLHKDAKTPKEESDAG